MNRSVGRLLFAVAGLAAVAVGVSTMWKGAQELGGSGLPSKTEAAAVARAAAADLTPFASPAHGITIGHPRTWDTETPVEGPLVLKFATWKGVVNCSVAVEDLATETALDAYVDLNLEGLRRAFEQSGATLSVLDRTPTTIGGRAGAQLRYSYVLKEMGVPVQVTQLYSIANRRGYAVTFTAPGELADAFSGLLQQIVGSVRFD